MSRLRDQSRGVLTNELGQMSIFLALVFQVLFVFFAMVINIGLLVHDKINLQNSVDFGAYYAAQRQAEILNEIAHLNYQIRQDYKLLAWRYWVVGTLGRAGQNMSQPPPQLSLPGTGLPEAPRLYSNGGSAQEEVPVACLANPWWWEFAQLSQNGVAPNENYCWHAYNWLSTPIPAAPVPFTPATAGINMFALQTALYSQANYTMSCQEASPLSWAFVATILADYKFSVAYKKKAIKRLRANLVAPDPLDRNGESIRLGVIATIQRNLTESNRAGFDPNSVQMLNGLTKGGCDANGGEPTLPEIHTAPGLYFALLTGVGTSCGFTVAFQNQWQSIQGSGGINTWDPPMGAATGMLRQMTSGEPLTSDDMHSSLGFEKNPWCMAYMGVKTTTRSRKPFAPFGTPTTLEARAFAQPFGGRIGPWYGKRWDQAASTSFTPAQPSSASGSADMNPHSSQMADRTDPITSPRLTPGGSGYVYSPMTLPNYSRYPGDRLGMRSMLAKGAARHYFRSISPLVPAGGPTDPRIRLNWFYSYAGFMDSGDSLAYDAVAVNQTGSMPPPLVKFRQVEMAAVAPDLFDMTYYSIDPAADLNYVTLARNNPGRYAIPNHRPVGDLGSRENANDLRARNIESQIDAVNSPDPNLAGVDPTLRGALAWLARDWRHILTGWAPHRVTNFTFPVDRFGACDPPEGEPLPNVMIPGKCVSGGRTGYSVRLISRSHLNGAWQVGGNGAGPNLLRNPPGGDTDF